MPAGRYDLYIEQGATYERVLTWKVPSVNDPRVCSPKNLTGYTARAQIRATATSPDPALVDLTSTPAAGLTLGGVAGTITLVITAAQTEALGDVATMGVWALELTAPDTSVVRLVEGTVEVSPGVVA